MTPRQADRVIKAGKPVTVYNSHWDETFTAVFVSRNRRMIMSADGGVFHRDELELVNTVCDCCDKPAKVTRVNYAGIETFACDACRGYT